MNSRIRQILDQINVLEDELHTAIEEQESRLRYRIEDKRVTFEKAIRDAHLRLRTGVFHWLLTSRPRNFLTIPVIYGMVAPLVLFDLCVSFYQAVCFPYLRHHQGAPGGLYRVGSSAPGLSECH